MTTPRMNQIIHSTILIDTSLANNGDENDLSIVNIDLKFKWFNFGKTFHS
ncbi:MAG: hypothetical protein QOK88_02390 [Nitrososphaeraceae archaeon]|nr:hypothetical protein [Nitrososphaeraceae archaeon]MDW0128255.1 hypothetical protein [Nitrososphaeraceae archaeon]MDW0134339.1 hypothetical protein [Nitrososphaeraceae archaeon]MDW0156395.1 hypothetical protein [Nitrososphaeraceae archaeon]